MYIIHNMLKRRLNANGSNFSPHLDWPVLSEASRFLTRSLSVHLLQLNNERNGWSYCNNIEIKIVIFEKKKKKRKEPWVSASWFFFFFTSDESSSVKVPSPCQNSSFVGFNALFNPAVLRDQVELPYKQGGGEKCIVSLRHLPSQLMWLFVQFGIPQFPMSDSDCRMRKGHHYRDTLKHTPDSTLVTTPIYPLPYIPFSSKLNSNLRAWHR